MNKTQITKVKPRRPIHIVKKNLSWKVYYETLKETFYECTRWTKVSAISGLCPDKSLLERTINVISFIILLLFSLYLSIRLWVHFFSTPIITSVSFSVPVKEIAFPALTICNPRPFVQEKLKNFSRSILIPPQYKPEQIEKGLEYIEAFTFSKWEGSENDINYKIVDEILSLNKLNLTDVAYSISPNCEDFLHKCLWVSKEFNCTHSNEFFTFKSSMSTVGVCCSFNYKGNNDSFVPFSARTYGTRGGLTILGTTDTSYTGLYLFVHHSFDFSTEINSRIALKPKVESFVEIMPTVSSVEPSVLGLSSKQRNCFIDDDVDMEGYRRADCILACRNKLIFQICGCYPYIYITDIKTQKECKLKDAFCYNKYFTRFRNARCFHCLPRCYDVNYDVETYDTALLQHNLSLFDIYSENLTEKSFMAKIYLKKQTAMSNRKITVMSWLNFMADIGGVYGLCLGFNLISLIEAIYMLTIVLKKNYHFQRTIIKTYPKTYLSTKNFNKIKNHKHYNSNFWNMFYLLKKIKIFKNRK